MKAASRRLSQNAQRGYDRVRAQSNAVTPHAGVIALYKGDSCFSTPSPINEAAAEAIQQGFTHNPPGILLLLATLVACGGGTTGSDRSSTYPRADAPDQDDGWKLITQLDV